MIYQNQPVTLDNRKKSPAGGSGPGAESAGPETWCKGNEVTRVCGDSCTKSPPATRQNEPETWCKGDGRIRLCGDSCTKSVAAAGRKCPETWCKGNGGTRPCGDLCTKSAAAARRPRTGKTTPAGRHPDMKQPAPVRETADRCRLFSLL